MPSAALAGSRRSLPREFLEKVVADPDAYLAHPERRDRGWLIET